VIAMRRASPGASRCGSMRSTLPGGEASNRFTFGRVPVHDVAMPTLDEMGRS